MSQKKNKFLPWLLSLVMLIQAVVFTTAAANMTRSLQHSTSAQHNKDHVSHHAMHDAVAGLDQSLPDSEHQHGGFLDDCCAAIGCCLATVSTFSPSFIPSISLLAKTIPSTMWGIILPIEIKPPRSQLY